MTIETPKPKPHRWSGWPGATCMNCGAEHTLEYAIGMNWYDPDTNGWVTQDHQRLIELCDNHCQIKMSKEDYEPIHAEIKQLEKKVDIDKEY